MAELSTWDKIRDWIKTLMPLLVLGIGWCLSNAVVDRAGKKAKARQDEIQAVEQQRSNDIAISQTIFNVLRTNLYPWLPGLAGTIKDSSLREIIDSAVSANPRIPDEIKVNVRERVTTVLGMESNSDTGKVTPTNKERGLSITNEPSIVVVYHGGDEYRNKALEIRDFLKAKGFENVRDISKGLPWYKTNFERYGVQVIWYRQETEYATSMRAYAQTIKDYLEQEGKWGKFMIPDNPPGDLADREILVVLPPDTN